MYVCMRVCTYAFVTSHLLSLPGLPSRDVGMLEAGRMQDLGNEFVGGSAV